MAITRPAALGATLDDLAERARSSRVLRVAVHCAAVAAGAALCAAGLAAMALIPAGVGAVVAGIAGVAATTVAGAAAGGLASRALPHRDVSGSTGLRRLAIAAAVVGGIALAGSGVGMFLLPAAAHAVAGASAALDGAAAGYAAAVVGWDRFTDAPVPPGWDGEGIGHG